MREWTRFTKRITVNATCADIYRAWMTQGGLESWFLRSAVATNSDGIARAPHEFMQAGDRYLWKWYGWGDEVNQPGEFLSTNGIDCLQFTFHAPMVVTVRILPEMDTNIVELIQENIPTDEDSRSNYFVGCGEGWTFYLANLKSILEGGIDLRNKDVGIKNVINA